MSDTGAVYATTAYIISIICGMLFTILIGGPKDI